MRKLTTFIALLGLSFATVACGEGNAAPAAPVKATQAQKAAAAANAIEFTENAEIENISKRIQLTSKPGAIGYIVLLNEAGQPILYTSVKGKLTSSGKRLTPGWSRVDDWDCGEWGCDQLVDAPSDEGTYGSSDPYIYFWDTNGAYHQWSGRYLYSDQPIRLRTEPLVVSIG